MQEPMAEPASSPGHHAALDELAQLCGIQASYHDLWGHLHEVSEQTMRTLLGAMGIDVSSNATIGEALARRRRQRFSELLPPVAVCRSGQPVLQLEVRVRAEQQVRQLAWCVRTEAGERFEGTVEVGQLPVLEQTTVEGQCYRRRRLDLALSLPEGYHRLEVELGDGPGAAMALCVVPGSCYEPPGIAQGRRIWGPAVQLYGLRRDGDWGMGDFTCLGQMVAVAKQLGAETVGVNPLHALFPARPAYASPYSPSSRLFLNVMYLDVERIDEFAHCEAAQRTVESAAFRRRRSRLQDQALVDYAEVAALKRPVLEQLYEQFRAEHLQHDTGRAQRFAAFVDEVGEPLHWHCLHEALQECFVEQPGWTSWPEAFRDPRSAEVADFARENVERVRFFQYLQWLAAQQLDDVMHDCQQQGLELGLYLDYAVSVDRAGAEVWANQQVYALTASAGAPPDDFNLAGQNWRLPPMSPEALAQAAYEPFIAGLRRNMRGGGALRIDHVMGLCRLFWVPEGGSAREGAYVRYPFEDLLGIVALESHRNRCMVIGEDLGTVPDQVRAAMARFGMLSYRPLLFERRADGAFKGSAEYVTQALVTATTHDLPTLQGYWTGHDIALRDSLGLYPSDDVRDGQLKERGADRQKLLDLLRREDLWSDTLPVDLEGGAGMPLEMLVALHAVTSRTPSRVLMVQWEDLLGCVEQANLPGTVQEYPNWRRRLPLALDQLLGDAGVQAAVAAINRERGRPA